MDFETFLESLFTFIKNSGNMYFVLYAGVTCIITQILKKLLVKKVSTEVFHKFDVAVVLPFVIGTGFAFLDVCYLRPFECEVYEACTTVLVDGATIGALSSVIFRFVSSLSGQSMNSLLKDDVFAVFYNQLLYFGKVREDLLERKLSMKDFVAEVKVISNKAKEIYAGEEDESAKCDKLKVLLRGILTDESVSECASIISKTLSTLNEKQ